MPFTPIELQEIERDVGGFCRRRFPTHLAEQIRLDYEVRNLAVVIIEARPDWTDPNLWIELDVAKLRYFRSRNEWRLYWKRASGKWSLYEPRRPSGSQRSRP